jgi:hypothetical protein
VSNESNKLQDTVIKIKAHQRPFLEQIRREEFRSSLGDAARSLIDREMARRSFGNGGDRADS